MGRTCNEVESEYWKNTLDIMYRTLARVFDHVSNHRERKLKNEAQLNFFTKVGVFDITSPTNMYFGRK